tara:strand:+ start:172 stop:426 length:255 start_codon:yes stop_codon:yes gene_type:complete
MIKLSIDIAKEVSDLFNNFLSDWKNADAGWSNYSRTLKRSIPGKGKIRDEFIQSLGELRTLAEAKHGKDSDMVTDIDNIMKAYR